MSHIRLTAPRWLITLALTAILTQGCTNKPLHVSKQVEAQIRNRCILVIDSDGRSSTATLLENDIAIAAQHAIDVSDDKMQLWSVDLGVFDPKILALGAPLKTVANDTLVYGDRKDFYRDSENDWIILELPAKAGRDDHAKRAGSARISEAKPGDIVFIGGHVIPDSIDLAKPISLSRMEFQKRTFRLTQGRVHSIDGDVLTFERIAGDELIGGMSGGPIMTLDSKSDDLLLVGIYLGTTTRAFIFKRELGRSVRDFEKMLPN